jgi:Zn-dependent M28 family amino/carboxypeptidase
MRILILWILALAGSLSTIAQQGPAALSAMVTREGLKKQLSVIASAEMEGRETGTEGQRRAAAYIASQFREMGLTPAPGTDQYQQFYNVGYDSLLESALVIGGRTWTQGKEFADETALNNNGEFKGKKLVFAGYGISDKTYDDYAGKKVKGKIVVIFSGEPKKDGNFLISGTKSFSSWTYPGGLTAKAELAAKKGAIGIIVINASMDSISTGLARQSKKSNLRLVKNSGGPTINAVTVALTGGRAILGETFFNQILPKARAFEPLNDQLFSRKLRVTYFFREQKILTQASNVCGYLEGTDKKDEYVILTGHYDHLGTRNGKIYYGADDDGSGTCAVLEMASAFSRAKAAGQGSRRTLIFMTVSGEEKGLWGSEYYSEHPLFPLEKTSVDLNTDMVGRIDPKRTTGDSMNYVYVIGDDKLSSDLKPISEGVNRKYGQLELDYKYNDPKDPERIYYRSDHYNFARKGVPIIFYFNGTHKDYHQPTDTIDKINWEVYEKRVRLIICTAWEMANREGMVKRDIPLN